MIFLFGYGSLIWRPDFQYVHREPAVLPGWERRFWQQSTDHRGTPESPGRVVTLIEATAAKCAGVLYTISPEEGDRILTALDHREKGGYKRLLTTVFLRNGTPISNTLLYHGTTDNPEFIGPEAPEKTAAIIAKSHGPSGANVDYLRKLAAALDELNESDPHVNELLALMDAPQRLIKPK